jgi:dolichol-phosphate mannosyltransferase
MDLHANPLLPSVCILIPVCNEAESLPLLRGRLHNLHQTLHNSYRLHYLFVDDGSSDETGRLLATAVPEGGSYEVYAHGTNRGIGAALRTGFQHTAADIVCTIDADCSYSPEHLSQMIQEVESGRTDVIVASPYHPQGGVEGVQLWRVLLSAQCSRLYRAVSPLKLYTYTSIFRVYKGAFVRRAQFRSDDFVAAVELLLCAAHLGCRIAEMPLTLRRRSAGVSKMRIARTIRGHAVLLLNCLLARNRGYPGFLRKQTSNFAQELPAPLEKRAAFRMVRAQPAENGAQPPHGPQPGTQLAKEVLRYDTSNDGC